MQPEIDLSGLKDLHLMEKPDLWPLAYGWWVLLGFIFLTIIIGIIGFIIWHNRPVVYAIRKVKKIDQKETDDQIYIKKLSQLMRRVAIAADGRPAIAQLSDESWQIFLQQRAPEILTKEEAYLIAFAPYMSHISNPINRPVLTEHVQLWIKKVLDCKKSS